MADELARARLDRLHDGLFVLDHEQKTAYFQERIINTVTSAPFLGVCAHIEPSREIHDPLDLVGSNLRLMGHPYNTKTVYHIVGVTVRSVAFRNRKAAERRVKS